MGNCSLDRNKKLRVILAITEPHTLQPSFADDEGNLLPPPLLTLLIDSRLVQSQQKTEHYRCSSKILQHVHFLSLTT